MKRMLLSLCYLCFISFTTQADIVDFIIEIDDPNIKYESIEYFEIVLRKTIELELLDVAELRISEANKLYPNETKFLYFEEIIAKGKDDSDRVSMIINKIVEAQDLIIGSEDFYITRANSFSEIEAFEEEQQVLLSAEATFPKSSRILHLLGRNYMNLGFAIEDEINYYSEAIEIDPTYAVSYFDRAGAYSAIENFEKSNTDYLKCIDLGYKPGSSYNCLAMNYNAMGETEKAIDANLLSIEYDAENISTYTNLCNIYRAINEFEKGIDIATKGLEYDPENYYTMLNLGLCYSSLENFKDAIATFSKFIELYPNDVYGWHFRGQCYKAIGEDEKSASDLDEVQRLQNG